MRGKTGKSMVRLEPAMQGCVRVTGGLLGERMETNRAVTLAAEYRQCCETGRLDAFRLGWKRGMANQPHYFWDSDVAKWIEAAAYSLMNRRDAELEGRVDEAIGWIASAQQSDGYLNVYFTVVEPENRWTNLRRNHELYCAGHLMEAAVAWFEATGKRTLLDVMCRYADYIGSVFGREEGKRRGYPGHEEIELALVKLWRATGERRYLDMAAYFVNERGEQPHYFDGEQGRAGVDHGAQGAREYDYCQAHVPVREQATAEGHAVRAMYLYAGMADVAAETGDRGLLGACRQLWENVTRRRMYVIGAVGSAREGERFTFDYDLPNETAYAETCANIGLMFFAHRMLQIEGDGEYGDTMERALYNGILSGLSLDGTRFFYANHLSVYPGALPATGHTAASRQEWFPCACCPPNIARLLASLPRYMYSTGAGAVWVHLYGSSDASLETGGGTLRVVQKTGYPWKETVRLEVRPDRRLRTTLALRIPGWCRGAELRVNGRRVALGAIVRKGYAHIDREWAKGDRVDLRLPMEVDRVECHPSVRMNNGKVALERGPVVYCLEETDNGGGLARVSLPRGAKLRARFDKDLLGGVVTITGRGLRRRATGWGDSLYRRAAGDGGGEKVTLRAVPYYAWNNRGEGEMTVWIREG